MGTTSYAPILVGVSRRPHASYRRLLSAISNAADSWRIPWLASFQDSEDVVPDSVLANLEVWSDDFTTIRDSERNVRLDGSTAGIFFHYSCVRHEDTHGRGSDAVNWAVALVRTAYGL